MIKPGRNDKKYFILISGDELDELQEHAWDFTECYGLNRRIYNYKGKRPMGLYRWDIEAMKEVISIVMQDPKSYPDQNSPEFQAISRLYARVHELYREAFNE